jgi:S1-C subfamily serine protease
VESSAQVRHRIALRGAGARVMLELWRAGKSLEITARLQESEGTPQGQANAQNGPTEEIAGSNSGIEGVGVGGVTSAQLRRAGVDEEGGVIVLSVLSSASVTGLRRGDLIVEADRKPVHTADELREAVRHSDDPVLLRVRRPDGALYLSVSK